MNSHRRPSRTAVLTTAALLVVAAVAVIGVQHSVGGTAPTTAPPAAAAPAPAAQGVSIPYTARVSLEVRCGPFPSARVTVDPTPGGHPDVHLEVIQAPYTGAPQHLFNTVSTLDLAMPARPVTVTVPVEQSATISVQSANTSVLLPRQQDFSCPQWQQQGVPNHV